MMTTATVHLYLLLISSGLAFVVTCTKFSLNANGLDDAAHRWTVCVCCERRIERNVCPQPEVTSTS